MVRGDALGNARVSAGVLSIVLVQLAAVLDVRNSSVALRLNRTRETEFEGRGLEETYAHSLLLRALLLSTHYTALHTVGCTTPRGTESIALVNASALPGRMPWRCAQ